VVSGGGISLFELVVLGLTSSAAPATVPVRIDFEAPPGCSDAKTFLRGLHARNAPVRLVTAGPATLRFSVRLRQTGRRVRGELQVEDGHGATDTRRVEGNSCDEVVAALSLTAALATEALLRHEAPPAGSGGATLGQTGRTEGGSPDEARSADSNPTGAPSDETTLGEARSTDRLDDADTHGGEGRESRSAAAQRSAFRLGVQLVATQVVDPVVNSGLSAFARFQSAQTSGLGLSLGLAVAHARNGIFGAPDEVAVRWTAILLTACPLRVELGSVQLEPCGLGTGGFLFAEGRDVAHPESVLRSWWSVGGLARASASVGTGVDLELELGMSAPLFRRRFITTLPEELVGQTPALSTLASVGLSLEL